MSCSNFNEHRALKDTSNKSSQVKVQQLFTQNSISDSILLNLIFNFGDKPYQNNSLVSVQVSHQRIFPPKYIIQKVGDQTMASKIILDNITFVNNPAPFLEDLELQITFTALQPIPETLDWKIIYVGSAKNEDFDQILEEFQIGPITEQSTMKFTLECKCPDYTKIPADELICVTALIITINYRGQEFIRVGYYVHNVLYDAFPEQQESSPAQILVKNTTRTILTEKPRITSFKIDWGEQLESPQENSNKIKTVQAFHSLESLEKKSEAEQKIKENEEKPQRRQQNESSQQLQVKKDLPNNEAEQKQKKFQ